MTRMVLLALASHWRRQPGQLLTLILGLALATGLWSAVQAINSEARANYAEAAAQLGAGQGQFLAPEQGDMSLADYIALRRAGWLVTPILEGRTRLGSDLVRVMGVDVLTYPRFPAPVETATDLSPLDVLGRPGRLFARPDLAEAIATLPGLPPVIASLDVPPGLVLTDIGTAEIVLKRPGRISRLLMLPEQPKGLIDWQKITPNLRATSPEGDTSRLTDSFHLNLTAFGFLSFAVGLFIVHGAVGLAFEQRRGMFRTLRALGVPARRLTGLVMAELMGLALLAGGLGLIIGYLVAAALLPDVAATLRGLYGAPVTGGLSLRPVWFASGLGMALGGAFIAGARGFISLARLPILTGPGVMTRSGAATGETRIMALIGLVLIALGVLAALIWQGLVAGFALLAGVLLGAALILPFVLQGMLTLVQHRARGVLAEWILADLRAQLPGLSLALMALLLALATNIGVGTMVSSFRLTFTGWLDHRLASELYVTAQSDAQGAEMVNWLAPRVDAVLPIRYGDITLAGQAARLYGVLDHDTYRDNWPLIAASEGAWDRLAAGQGALVNEQLARRENLWPGAEVTLAPELTLPIVGVYSDYGNPSGQAIIGLDLLLDRFDGLPNRQFGLRLARDDIPDLIPALTARFDLPDTAIVNQEAIKTASLGIFEKTFVVTGALNVLTLGVASFAILTSLLTLWSARLPHLAPVWALGLTRARLARLEILRSVILTALTALLALPLGLVLAWVLLAIINVEAFGWRLPMFLFPRDWIVLLALALLAGAVAALIPARRLHRLPPADLLKVFAHER